MASVGDDEQEEVYDVERILAERVEDGITRYLVKWQGYPDEQCTWEPAENFDTSETLATWTKQKALGDILEADDLRRIQRQMDSYQAILSSLSETEYSHHTSEGESDVDFDHLQPPKKRPKMVHDPPPLSSRARHVKQRQNQRRGSIQNIRSSPIRSPIDQNRTTKDRTTRMQESKATTSNVKRTRTPRIEGLPAKADETSVPLSPKLQPQPQPQPQPRPTTTAPPTTFHAPDLNSRKPRSGSISRPRRRPADKPFRNLQHQNNALKKQATRYYVDLAPTVPHQSPNTGNDNVKTTAATQPPEQEPNDSWLFFSEDDLDDDENQSANRQDNNKRPRRYTSQSVERNSNDPLNKQVEIKDEARLKESLDRTVMPLTSTQHTDNVSSSCTPDELEVSPPRRMRTTRSQEKESTAQSMSTPRSQNDTNKDIDALRCAAATQPNARRANPEQNEVSMDTREETMRDISTSQSVALSLMTDDHYQASTTRKFDSSGYSATQAALKDTVQDIDQIRGPSTSLSTSSKHTLDSLPKLETQCPDWRYPLAEAVTDKHTTRQPSAPSNVVRVATGRQWIKGDLVVEVFLTQHLAGGIKIENLTWEQRAPIIQLKPKNEHTLPLYFDNVITYNEYQSITSSSIWWSTFGVGAVEAFPDSDVTVSLAADYLETNDVAAYWLHPHKETDLMLLLYSCRSPSWQHLHPPKPTRSGVTRLQMVCRNKFLIQHTGIAQSHTSPTTRDARAVGVKSPARRYRRASIVSDSSVNLHNESTKSPRKQLAREMEEHNLNAKNRHDDDLLDTAGTGRTLTMVASKETRLSSDIQRSALEYGTKTSLENVISPHSSTVHAEPIQLNGFRGLDRDVKQLGRLPLSIPSRINQYDIRILLVHQPKYSTMASDIQKWLLAQTPGSEYVLMESTQAGLNDTDHKNWVEFKLYLQSKACVLICDSLQVVSRTGGFAKLLEHDNMVCWQIDLRDDQTLPLETVRLFPTGIAMALTQQCFLVEPNSTMYLLQWFKHRAEKPYSASRLILPPNIFAVIHEQVLLSSRPETKQCFLDLMSLIQGLTRLSVQQGDDDLGLGFHLLLPRWEEVYADINLTTAGLLTAVEQKHHDEAMSDAFNKYFGAWAILNATRHRRFMGILTTTKPKYYEHVRWTGCKDGAIRLEIKEKGRNATRSRSRGRSGEYSRADSTDEVPHERSRGK